MSDQTLASLTAATPATGGLLYGTQGGADRKFTLTAAGAALMEAADAIKLDELAAPTDVTTLNATTSAHGLLPKLGGGTTNFLRADGSWAAPGGGSINLPLRAWVESTGNDGTGTVGDPGKPFLTMLAAYTAGARMMHLGAGTFAGITKAGSIDLTYIGQGRDKTTIAEISSTNGSTVKLRDAGYKSALAATINTSQTGTNGTNGGPITLHNVLADTVMTSGMNGDEGGGNGGAGADLAGSEIEIITALYTNGGDGGTVIDTGEYANGGSGGAAGNVTVTGRLHVGSILNAKGGVPTGGANGGGDGSPGLGGTINVEDLFVGGTLSLGGGASNGTPGNLTAFRAYIAYGDLGSSEELLSTITGSLIVIPSVGGYYSNGGLVLSHINGSAVGTA